MLKNESFFRLFSIGFLGILFLSINALADKKPSEPKSVFTIVEHVEEAERINNNQLHVLNLTSIGERVEIITPKDIKNK